MTWSSACAGMVHDIRGGSVKGSVFAADSSVPEFAVMVQDRAGPKVDQQGKDCKGKLVELPGFVKVKVHQVLDGPGHSTGITGGVKDQYRKA